MGFPREFAEKCSTIEAFTCAVCDSLVDYRTASYTICSHVFCLSCLSKWLERDRVCPSCRTSLNFNGVADLRVANPLAWRVLGKLHVKCPISEVACDWTGDYSELSAHLTSTETHRGVGRLDPSIVGDQAAERSARARAEAEGLKEAANAKYQERQFHESVKLYSKAIAAMPGVATYYGNRAAAWFMVGAWKECIGDCEAALALDASYLKPYSRLAKAQCELGNFDAACGALERAVALNPASPELQEELGHALRLRAAVAGAEEAMGRGEGGLAAEIYAEAAKHTSAPSVALGAAAAELARGNADRAQRLTLQLIKQDPQLVRAYSLRGLAFFQAGDLDQAEKHLREAIRLDIDNQEAIRAVKQVRRVQQLVGAARQGAFSRDFEMAVREFTAALEAGAGALPTAAPLATAILSERAAAHLRLGQLDACLADCDAAVAAREDCKAAYLTRTSALLALGRHEEALKNIQVIAEIDPGDAVVQRHVQKAEFELRKAKRPDYYALVGCGRTATVAEVKAAYRARALEWHPDRHSDATEEKRAEAEARFKEIGEALEILSDPLKRQLYDEGYDKEAISERVAAAQRAAHNRTGDTHGHGSRGAGRGGCGSGGGGGSC